MPNISLLDKKPSISIALAGLDKCCSAASDNELALAATLIVIVIIIVILIVIVIVIVITFRLLLHSFPLLSEV